ncbi:MAG TPA: universal stress protein [Bryobacteraceae bacterium]|jgi:universal stress protein A
MPLFHNILFPTDFSKRSHAVAPAVRAMAERNQAHLTVLHSFELPIGGYGDAYAYMPSTIEDFHKASQSSMDRFVKQHFSDFDSDSLKVVVESGGPVESIVEYVDENAIDLIMMTSHGHSRFRALLLGSVTAGVLHDTHCPVWTDVHCDESPAPAGPCQNIVCAIDLSQKSVEPLRFAKRLACENRANLYIVHSEPAIEDIIHSQSATRFHRFLEFRAREDFEPLAQQANLEIPLEVVSGPLGESIADATRRHKGDMLIIGRGVIEERLGRLRTDAYDIIRRSPCPVLSV